MPASRTRKKAQEKKKTEKRVREENARAAAFKRVFEDFSNTIQPCTTCKSERVEVCLEEVEESQREAVEKMLTQMMESGMEANQLVYCKECNEYAGLSSPTAF
jgi:5'-deoxynucleotidase YfbR-like HD superfamily hydrolase